MGIAERIFWGAAAAAGTYLLVGWGFGAIGEALPRVPSQGIVQAQAGGHIMPNGQRMAGDMGGMGCGMGGGCGCGSGPAVQ